MKKLPIFQGYTVDMRLKQFRRITKKGIEFIDFDSKKGTALLKKYIDILTEDNE